MALSPRMLLLAVCVALLLALVASSGSAGSAEVSYDPRSASGSLAAEVERLEQQARMGWDKELRQLSWYGLDDGQVVLDVGCGPAFTVRLLLDMLPELHVVCLEPDGDLLAEAARVTAPYGDRVTLVQGEIEDAESLPEFRAATPEGGFDMVIARYVLQHVADPILALERMHDLVRIGGVVAIADVDAPISGVVDPPVHSLAAVLPRYIQSQRTRGGDRLIGRRLARFMYAAGLDEIQVDAVLSHSDQYGIELFRAMMTVDRLRVGLDEGWLTKLEMDRITEEVDAFFANEDSIAMSVVIYTAGKRTTTYPSPSSEAGKEDL